MSDDQVELTLDGLLEGLAGEIRSPTGPGGVTKNFNEQFITEFRSNGGQVRGELADSPFLLLTTTGARSGKQRITPLAYVPVDDRILIVASKGGAKTHPAWYWNLIAHPQVEIEIGAERYQGVAVELKGADRDACYSNIAARVPTFAGYQTRTDRVIPLFELRRAD
ncbi:MAG: deazaflavin-dependent oxidoreductase (nitroreductase family) [Limisphaerales bacterium]|jgi:deazaflavin-dependent oxidoreductase (nitroreductase family)